MRKNKSPHYHNHKLLMGIALALVIIASIAFFGAPARAQTCRSSSGGYCAQVAAGAAGVPGLEFLNLTNDASLNDLFTSVYYFLFTLIGIAALGAFIWAGVLYASAGDNTTRTTSAKTWMQNASMGLALALTSWLILKIINPDLVAGLNLDDAMPSVGGRISAQPSLLKNAELTEGEKQTIQDLKNQGANIDPGKLEEIDRDKFKAASGDTTKLQAGVTASDDGCRKNGKLPAHITISYVCGKKPKYIHEGNSGGEIFRTEFLDTCPPGGAPQPKQYYGCQER